MKKRIVISSILVISSIILFSFYAKRKQIVSFYNSKENKTKSTYLEGDIIFQSSNSNQCKAVKLATHSEYSHVGMITYIEGKPFVLEAVEPVRTTPLTDWIAHGIGGHYTVMRLKERNDEILDSEISIAQQLAKKMIGTHYDVYFNWSDDELYCSELVWKIYKRGYGVELCALRKMKDFDLTSPAVKAIMKQRYGNNPPLEERVVAPSDLSNAPLLYVVERK